MKTALIVGHTIYVVDWTWPIVVALAAVVICVLIEWS